MLNLNHQYPPLRHGGDLATARTKYSYEDWIDLSTGISPWTWPVVDLPESVWNQLPQPNTALINAAAEYYGVDSDLVFATPGSQLPIRLIPQLLPVSTVAIPVLGYQEHLRSWQLGGHKIVFYADLSELLELLRNKRAEHAVVINPNNPSTEFITAESVQEIEFLLPGTLVLDEAFMDVKELAAPAPDLELPTVANQTIRLRSIGKFFGLAGLRVGFALGSHTVLVKLDSLLQPWSISHASQVVAEGALRDTRWQLEQAQRITDRSKEFDVLLNDIANASLTRFEVKSAGLFKTLFLHQSELVALHDKLAQCGIWTRLFNRGDAPAWLRFGLPLDLEKFREQLSPMFK